MGIYLTILRKSKELTENQWAISFQNFLESYFAIFASSPLTSELIAGILFMGSYSKVNKQNWKDFLTFLD